MKKLFKRNEEIYNTVETFEAKLICYCSCRCRCTCSSTREFATTFSKPSDRNDSATDARVQN